MKKKIKRFILKDDGNNKYNSGEVITLLESITDSINFIAEQHGEIIKSIGLINKNIEVINKRLDKIESRLDRMEDDIREIKITLKNKVGRSEFEKLEKRVVKLEKLAIAR